jgi:hypothetical protein
MDNARTSQSLFGNIAAISGPLKSPTDEAPSARPKRDTKRTGDASEAHVIKALVDAGFSISIPFGENHRYDLVADDGERLLRVQVKTGRLRGSVIKFACCSTHAHRGGTERSYFGEIELLAVYCPETRKVYLLPESQLVATRTNLRIDPPKNGMKKRIRWAQHFELP